MAEDEGKITEKHIKEALTDDKYANLPKNLAEEARKTDKGKKE